MRLAGASSSRTILRRFLYPQAPHRRGFVSLSRLTHTSSSNNAVQNTYYPPRRPISSSSPIVLFGTPQQRFKSSMPAFFEDDDSNNTTHNDQEQQQHVVKTNNQKTIPFLLADIGEGIAEVEILQWFVQPGDPVRQFDRVCEVQSDKATVEITSRYDGVVASIANAEEMVAVGTPLMHMFVEGNDDSDSDEDDVLLAANQQMNESSVVMNNVDDEEDKLCIPTFRSTCDDTEIQENTGRRNSPKVMATPAVRKISMDYGLELGNILGSGPKGRVLKADVLQILRNKGLLKDDELQVETTASSKSEPAVSSQQSTKKSSQPLVALVQDETVPIRGYNRLMVKTMTDSLSIPHMCYADEINMNAVLQARSDTTNGIKLSVLPFAIKAASLAIRDYPVLNSSICMEKMNVTRYANHNIGVAMDTPRGLAVPVVKGCQNLSILEIADELQRLKLAAAEGTLCEDDISGATFTLSNIGAIGGTYMSPIVAAPQVAIGAMGKIQRLPRFSSDDSTDVEVVNIMQISWGGDHRVIDGATLARFSNRWKDLMENPMSMVFCMK
eukprot:CAMPEP_0119005316 /NCGR_PEP_ID=MMETSP1176-20130426/1645_1 /TAXON_ID=265551 /ORGANISM="Synedropsis recta cf, Strain CCMP1620" /LENGTH=554 /DNA_ID=CAMNT_0006957105 /DNA_START=139 /DNA_END=1803 /DNA_ORIENTATION=-